MDYKEFEALCQRTLDYGIFDESRHLLPAVKRKHRKRFSTCLAHGILPIEAFDLVQKYRKFDKSGFALVIAREAPSGRIGAGRCTDQPPISQSACK